jgi:hypothetical protein
LALLVFILFSHHAEYEIFDARTGYPKLFYTSLYYTKMYNTFVYMQKAPFRYGTLAEGAEFTNRTEETKRLVNNFRHGINSILISPRRWGKSSLVKYASQQPAAGKTRFCFIDLFNIRTESEFYQTLSREVIKAGNPKWRVWLKDMGQFFKQLMPVFNISPDPNNDLTISLNWEEVKKNPAEILNLAESICKARNIKMVICMDEFQNISFYEDPLAFQKKLRAHWQHHRQVSYCLFGSRRHMLMEFFTKPSMPFYKFGDLIFLEKISERYWIPFIQQRFQDTGKKINEKQAGNIAAVMENHPYFVQQLAQQVWLLAEKNVTEEIAETAIRQLLEQHHFLFQREVDQLTIPQINFLQALLKGVEKFTAAENLKQYRLGTAGNIKRIREALESKEIIDSAAGKLEILDPLFRLWLERVYFKT